MELHLGALLFLLSPMLCAGRRPFARLLARVGLRGDSADSDAGDLVTASRGEPSAADWRYLFSEEAGDRCKVQVVNELSFPVLFCWVDPQGDISHYSVVSDASIRDGSVRNVCSESTFAGHVFIGLRRSAKRPTHLREVRKSDFLFMYTPRTARARHVLRLQAGREVRVRASCEVMVDQGAPIDSSDKHYDKTSICGFTVFYEPGVFENLVFKQAFFEDLEAACARLPPRALARLKLDTHFWLNKSFVYGRTDKPIRPRSCCFHESAEWLRDNGHSTLKRGCVEVYSAAHYTDDRELWGVGGVLVHELSHAYHAKHCPKGFDCDEILAAYNSAMDKRLYDAVGVHGPQGVRGKCKAYACMNQMEFWAELSTAYHWDEDETGEYNKWYPHNRFQLVQHDFATFQVLHKLWHV